jgi:DNA polymerase-3 subunit epsilon
MFHYLSLNRPLAVLDLETTGVDPQTDRIVEVSVLKVLPDGDRQHRTCRVNPGIPIPAAATAVHGITDADVAGEPSFGQVAAALEEFLRGCDLCGFNIKRFDLPLLYAEFRRAGVPFVLEGRALVDPQEIYHHFERRDLTSAVRFYLGRAHHGAHSAAADVLATAEVLDAMLGRYAELTRTGSSSASTTRFGSHSASTRGSRWPSSPGRARTTSVGFSVATFSAIPRTWSGRRCRTQADHAKAVPPPSGSGSTGPSREIGGRTTPAFRDAGKAVTGRS